MMHPWPVRNRVGPLVAALVASIGLLGMAVGCGESSVSEPPPSVRSISDPWQPAPFAVPPELVTAAVEACRANRGMLPDDTEPVVADTRGGNAMLIGFAGPGGEGDCMLRVPPQGRPVVEFGGGGTGEPPRMGPTELRVFSSSTSNVGGGDAAPGADRGYVVGQLGSAVAQLQIEVTTGERLQATISSAGWFAAWWPGTAEFRRAQGFDAAGALVAEAG
jgi:hypothetical protein